MSNFFTGIENFVNDFGPYIKYIAAAGLLVVAVMFLLPSSKLHEVGKAHVGHIFLGIGLGMLAVSIVTSVSGYFTF